ncbi:hypothetical protein [Pseudoblastomonas halimionae]|uniref:Uncharacterized protein n=1 Tax=Alteriqipengyuania halimionae TaxID=1926630 RepID=A0A6I4U2P2_9SPHN|nr:hypothetical protein [Alteriqipengyuania halimionae]MXP10339.1 hypothetical protein [Alteriqipengyuania halimionae]
MKAIAGWIGRHLVVFALLVCAIAFVQQGGLAATRHALSGDSVAGELSGPAEIGERLTELRAEAKADLASNLDQWEEATSAKRREALESRKRELAAIDRQLEQRGVLGSVLPSRIIEGARLKLRRAVMEREIAVLEARVDLDNAKQAAANLAAIPGPAAIAEARAQCDAVNAEIHRFNARSRPVKATRNRLTGEADKLTAQSKEACGRLNRMVEQRRQRLAASQAAQAQVEAARRSVDDAERSARAAIKEVRLAAKGNTLRDILVKAAIALVAIILTPYLIRFFLYYIVAPLAERRAAIRLTVPGGSQAPMLPTVPSRISIPVELGASEELLVRQHYLQTTSLTGTKRTRWLLDYRHPVSSIAAGLAFLTRVEGAGETTTISAVEDPFAELAELELPAGASCVLHPRALVALVQPAGSPMRITSHWRLFSLNAWLTLQLRYLVFHGPVRLIVKGGRGVRIEQARSGRIFGQDQLVGFSADLAYSVTRNETFAPYLFGQEPLFKDKVESGRGVLVIEEAPLAGRKGGVRRGLEGAMDAFLKVFGI